MTEEPPACRSSAARTITVAVALVALVLGGVFVASTARPGREAPPGSAQQQTTRLDERPAPTKTFPLPDAELEALPGGDPVELTDYRGAPLVINFWASWCAPCVQEMPELQAAATELAGTVTFLGVNVEDSAENAEPFMNRLGVDYDLAADPAGDLHRELGIFGMPTTLLVDEDGVVQYRHTGPLNRQQLTDLLAEYLNLRT